MEDLNRQSVLDEVCRVAFGEADDSSGSKLKYASKLRALELLGKPLGLFDRTEAGGDVRIVDDIPEENSPCQEGEGVL